MNNATGITKCIQDLKGEDTDSNEMDHLPRCIAVIILNYMIAGYIYCKLY